MRLQKSKTAPLTRKGAAPYVAAFAKIFMMIDFKSAEMLELVRRALAEDVGSGDVTALATVPAGAVGAARILARENVVVAGLPLAGMVFAGLDPAMNVEFFVADGVLVKKGRDLLRLAGSGRSILTGERTALNFLTHLSGIATLTRRFVELLAGTGTKIRDTRKTVSWFTDAGKICGEDGWWDGSPDWFV